MGSAVPNRGQAGKVTDAAQRSQSPSSPGSDQSQAFQADVETALPGLRAFLRRERLYHVSAGDLQAAEVSTTELVDDVLAEAWRRRSQRPPSLSFHAWLVSLAVDVIRRRVERARRRRAARQLVVPLERAKPQWDEGDDPYLRPLSDDLVTLADLVPNPESPVPDDVLESAEVQRRLMRLLDLLPRRWRQTFVLFALECLSIREIASIQSRAEEGVERDIDRARDFLAAHIEDEYEELLAGRVTRDSRPGAGEA